MESNESLDEAGTVSETPGEHFDRGTPTLLSPGCGTGEEFPWARVSWHFAQAGTTCRTEWILHQYLKHSHAAASTVSYSLSHWTAYALAILPPWGLLLQTVLSRKGLAGMFMECPFFPAWWQDASSSQCMRQSYCFPSLLVREGRSKIPSCQPAEDVS